MIAAMLAVTVTCSFSQKKYSSKDSVQIYRFLDMADEVSDVNIDSAMHYARLAHRLSIQKQMTRGEGWALLKIGDLKRYTTKPDSVEIFQNAGLAIAKKLRDHFMEGLGHLQLGQYYMFQHRYAESEKHYADALAIHFEREQSEYTAIVYSDLGLLFQSKGQYEKQVEWLLKAKRLGDKLHDKYAIASTSSNLAVAYDQLGDRKKAFENLREAIRVRKELGNKVGLSNNYNSLARMLQKDSLSAAIGYQKLAIYYAKQTGVKGLVAGSLSTMALLKGRQGKKSEALDLEKKAIAIFKETGDKHQEAYRSISAANFSGQIGDREAALKFFENAHNIASQTKNLSMLRDVSLHKANYFKDQKDYYHAYQNFRNYALYKDSLIQEKTQSNIAELQLKYDTEKKDNEIALLTIDRKVRQLEIEKQKTQLANQKLMRNGIIGGTGIILLLIGFMFNRYQLKKKIEQQELLINFRNDVARDLHDDIGSTLTSIKILSEVSLNNLLKDQTKAGSYLKKITEQSSHMQQEMSDIVWSIKPDNDKLANMLVRMREFASYTLEPKNIKADFVVNQEVLLSSLNMQQRRDFFLIFKEAINNTAKYAQASSVSIVLEKAEKHLLLTVKDNGIGFNVDLVRSSNGIRNMEARAKSLSGTFHISSEQGLGTTIEVQIPLI
ncbi:tetratricopeptide repeat-containing sensor histidine kinase [Dyadobacter pollutisoli]|uniref:Sensor histidine kinase n=1 Tax=Dyadobacter pollutisoli TaxID=2910158 RepID=A0A9E8SI09_9BACT|nr:sensor histidine kinase [Dyadobacter pollutisoli]WAC09273.1 sensor histidine kinase [Dyadobacter pollutisoli]